MPALVLIHSPLVGPLTWQPSADALQAQGYRVVVPSLSGVLVSGPPYYPKLAGKVATVVRHAYLTDPVALVGHSGAGPVLPAIAETVGLPVCAVVFVDAGLPHPGASWLQTAPAALRHHLQALARDGRLPPWHRWFPPGAVEELLPDADLRARFTAELTDSPLAYFEESAPAVPGWPPATCGYLQLSSAYAEAADEAARCGWLTTREPADHLAMLTRPQAVATWVYRLLEAMLGGAPTAL